MTASELTSEEEKVIKAFEAIGSDDAANQDLRRVSGIDEEDFLMALGNLERRGFVRRYFGHTLLLTKARLYLRRKTE